MHVKSLQMLAIIVEISMTVIAFMSMTQANDTSNSNQDQLLIQNSNFPRQLTRHRIPTTLCDMRTLHTNSLSPVQDISMTNESLSNSAQTADEFDIDTKRQEQSKLNIQLECGYSESISIVGLDDLTALGHGKALNPLRQLESMDDVCRERLTMLRVDGRGITNPGHLATEQAFLLACTSLLAAQRDVFHDLVNRCNGSQKCSLFSGRNKSIFMQDCSPLKHKDLTLFIEVSYVCLPMKTKFSTRIISYKDLSNRIACLRGKLLYLSRVTLNIIRDQQHYAEDEIIGKAAAFDKSTNELIQRRHSVAELVKCVGFKLIPSDIFDTCHAHPRCYLSLKKQLRRKSGSHHDFETFDFTASYLSLEYMCLSEDRFAESVTHPETDQSTTNNETSVVFDLLNKQDFNVEPSYQSELGLIKINQMRPNSGATQNPHIGSMIYFITLFIVLMLTYLPNI